MILIVLTAVLAGCGAAKLDRSYLPPASAKTAGGSPGALQAPLDGLPSGSYTNDAQGVVVDAAAPGTRTSGPEPTGLGGPRTSYGSTDSKVGDAAFKGSLTGFGSANGPSTRIAPGFGSIVGVEENTGGPSIRIAPGFNNIVASEGTDDDKTRVGTVKYANEIGLENYSYGFETDNGIAVGENGVAADGIKANGEYSYKGDDGKVYSVSYTADEGGYKPQGSHLPTPPPIPDEILKSLEQNAKEEAAGHVDDGSYDAQKYNDEGDYTSNNGDGNNNRPSVSGGDATASGTFVHGSHGVGTQAFGSHTHGDKASSFGLKDQSQSQGFGISGGSLPGPQTGHQGPTQGFHSHTTQNRFGIQPVKPGSSASAVASSDNEFNSHGSVSPAGIPSLHSQQGLRLPGFSNGNSAYSSAVTSGSGSASAFASTGPEAPGFKNQYSSNPNAPATATASATAQGQGAAAEALSTSKPSYGGPSFNKVPASTYSTFGSTHKTPNKGLGNNEYLPPVNIVESTGQVPHGANNYGAASGSLPSGPIGAAFGSGNQPSFNLPSQHSNAPNSGNFPTSFGQSQSQAPLLSGAGTHSQAHSGSNAPTNSVGSSGKPSGQYNNHGPDAATAASNFGSQRPEFSSQPFNTKPGQYTQTGALPGAFPGQSQFPNNQPSSVQSGTVFPSVVAPTKVPSTELSTPFESNEQGTDKFPSPSPTQPTFGSSFPSNTGQYKPQTGSNSVNFATSTPKPSLTQQQGADHSYYYNQPSKPFVTPISQYQTSKFPSNSPFGSSATGISGQNFGNRQPIVPASSLSQQGSKYTNTPVLSTASPTQSGQYQGSTDSSYYNGITQASISPFPSVAPTIPTKFESQSSQLGSKPTTQIGSSSSQTQFGTAANQQTFGQKPIGQSQSSFGQESSSQTGNNQKPTQQGTIYEYNKPATSTSGQVTSSQTDSQVKPSQTFGSQGTTQFGQQQSKPFGNSAQGTSFQHSQNQGFGSQTTSPLQSGQKPFGSSQTGFNYQQTQFGSAAGSQFGQKPVTQPGSSLQQTQFGSTGFGQKPSSSQVVGQQNQGTVYEYNKPTVDLPSDKEEIVEVTSISSGSQLEQGSSLTSGASSQNKPVSQFGTQPANTQFGQKPQITQGPSYTSNIGASHESGKKPVSSTQTSSTFSQGQTAFGSQPISHFGQKPLTNQGSQIGQVPAGSVSSGLGQTSQYGNKPVSTTQTGSTFPQSQTISGSYTASQFGQKPLTNQVTGFGSQTGSTFQQTQFGSGLQSSQGSGFTSGGQTTQFGEKPAITTQTGTYQQTQTVQGSTFGSQPFGQKPQTSQGTGFGTSQFGTLPQNQFSSVQGSQFGQQPQSVGNVPAPQVKPISQYGQKPIGSSFQGTQFGSSTGTQPGQKPQETSAAPQGQTSQFGIKPTSQFGSSFPSRFGQKPFGSSQIGSTVSQTQIGSISKFEQKPQLIQGASLTSTGVSGGQTSTLFGQKPSDASTSVGSTSSLTQFGSTLGQKPIQSGTSSQQPTFGISTGSQYTQKPQSVFTSSTPSKGQSVQTTQQFVQKPFGSSQITNQFSSSTDSKFGQNTHTQSTQGTAVNTGFVTQTTSTFSQKPFGTSQIGTSGTQFSQKPQTTQGSFSSGSKGQTIQTTQFGLKPLSSSLNKGSSFTQTQFGSNIGSTFGQKPQTTGTVSPTTGSFGQKPIVVSHTGNQQSQFGTISNSYFGNKPVSTQSTSFTSSTTSKDQSGSTSQLNVKPVGSSQPAVSTFPQTQFGSNAGSQYGLKPQLNTGTVSSTIAPIQSLSQYGKKPFGSESSQGSLQQTQFGSSAGSQFGQNTGSQGQSGLKPSGTFGSLSSSQFGQKPQSGAGTVSTSQVQPISQYGNKPFGSQYSQGTQQTQLSGGTQPAQNVAYQGQVQFGQKPFGGQTFGSAFQQTQSGQKPAFGTQASGSTFGQSSQFGTQAKKPLDTTQSPFQTQFNSITGQKPQTTASAFASSSGSLGGTQFGQGSKYQTGTFGTLGTQQQKPFGGSFTQTTQQQYTQTSGQFGTQSQKPFGSSQSVFQQSQHSGKKPFGSQGSTFQLGQAADQKTQQTQSNIHTSLTSVSAQSSSQSPESVQSSEGYNYQKPQTGSGSLFGEPQKSGDQKFPAQTTFGQSTLSQTSGDLSKPFSTSSTLGTFEQKPSTAGLPQFGVQPTKPGDLNSPFGQTQYNGQPLKPVSTVSPFVTNSPQFGVQPTKPTLQSSGQSSKPHGTPSSQISIEQLQSSAVPTAQFGVQPTQGAFASSQQPSQTSGSYGGQPIKPNVFGSSQSTFPSSGLGAIQDSTNQGSSVSTVQTPIVDINKHSPNSFVGKGEEFGGPRDPPRYDDKTGYHY